jgi:acetyl esterase/lipase
MKFPTTILFMLALSLLGAQPAPAGDSINDRLRYGINPFLSADMDLPYGPDPEERADVIKHSLWANGAAVVMIHGGGWSEGERLHMSADAQRLANEGFTVINISYRLGKAGKPHTFWPAQLQDAQLAVRWARKNAGELGIDAQRICAYGASAGGHLSMLLGYARTIQPGDRADIFTEQSPAVNCVVNVGGPANLSHPAIIAKISVLPFLGTSKPEEIREILRAASPIHFLDENSAPTMIVQGREDDVVPKALSGELTSELKKKNLPFLYLEVDGGHVFMGTPDDQREAAEGKITSFLKSHLIK